MTRRGHRLAAAVALGLAPVLVAACGSPPSARHVVGSPAAPTYPSSGAGAPPAGSDPLETPAAEQAVRDAQSGLGALDDGLAQVNTDLNSPQADS